MRFTICEVVHRKSQIARRTTRFPEIPGDRFFLCVPPHDPTLRSFVACALHPTLRLRLVRGCLLPAPHCGFALCVDPHTALLRRLCGVTGILSLPLVLQPQNKVQDNAVNSIFVASINVCRINQEWRVNYCPSQRRSFMSRISPSIL